MRHARTTARGAIAATMAAAVMLFCQSCNIGAPLYYLAVGPPKTPALCELADRPTVVFVDDRNNRIPERSEVLRRAIADRVSTDLMKKKVITTTIRPADAMSIARQEDRYNSVMAMDAIAESVGAEQIIYVQVLLFKDSPDGYTPRPVSACHVQVVDAVARQRIFPAPDHEDSVHMVQVAMAPVSTGLYTEGRSRYPLYQLLAEDTGEKIAKLFYEHETVELGGNLDPR